MVEEGGQILGYWCLYNAVHLEPLYLDPEARHRHGVVRALWGGVLGRMRELGITAAHATVGDADLATNLPLATKLGFQVIPGTALFLDVTGAKEI